MENKQLVSTAVTQANDTVDLSDFIVFQTDHIIQFYFPKDIWDCMKIDFERLNKNYFVEVTKHYGEYSKNNMDFIPDFKITVLGYYFQLRTRDPF